MKNIRDIEERLKIDLISCFTFQISNEINQSYYRTTNRKRARMGFTSQL